MPETHLLIVSPSPKHSDSDTKAAGRFDARSNDFLLAERTYTPFCTAARALLAKGLASPADRLVMRHTGQDHNALRATVGAAAKLTVIEAADGKPRFAKWTPPPGMRQTPPMRRTDKPATHIAPNP